MKTVPLLIIGLILILGLSITPFILIHNTSHTLANNLDNVEHAIYQQQWDKAKEQLAVTTNTWEHTKGTWSSIIDHQEIDNIDISISRLEQYVNTRGESLAAGEVSALKKLVEHIADIEKPTLTNIF